MITGRSDAPLVYLEVKTTADDGATPFDISAGEWKTALDIHTAHSDREYAIVRVEHVRSAPALHRIFVDPICLNREGFLEVEWKDLRIYGG